MENQKEKPQEKIEESTLEQFGPNLPLGIETNGRFQKSIVEKSWTFKQEKELSKLRQDNKRDGLAHYVSKVLSFMYSKFAGFNFDEMKEEQKLLQIGQMYAGDVFYAYCWLRYKTMGKELKMKCNCPKCGAEFKFFADIRTIPIFYSNSVKPFMFDYKLETPYEYRGNKIEGYKMIIPRWNTYEKMTSVSNVTSGIGVSKFHIIHGSIYSHLNEDTQKIILEDELDNMCKKDIERLADKINDNLLGPKMAIDVKCTECRHEFEDSISWGYDNFFGNSSR